MRRFAFSLPLALSLATLAAPAAAQITVAVDPTADAHAISPLIYGANFPSDAQIAAGRLTLGRWGGNTTSRYNYEIDVWNTGFDYYFENVPGCWNDADGYCASPPADPKETSGSNKFLAQMKSSSMVALFTVPTLGWIARPPPKYAHPFDCGCPATVTPNQNSFDPYDTNCGDGRAPGGNGYVQCAAPSATSVEASPAWAKAWVEYIVSKHGPSNGQRIYALDNEPMLWSSTHRDIRTQKLGYDELWQRMRDYAVAILEADPTAEIAGPAEWGWPNYFCSDLDNISQGCSESSPDRAAHGGTPLIAWLLQQAKAHEDQTGQRILHYLDLHYYPQGGDPPAITRSLWDPEYTDPSWIADTIRLVPRMREWVEQSYPGTKLAVSEYDFYHHAEPVGAVTYAEVLGIFGREGVHLATAWGTPSETDVAFAAYRLYRNFDGNGGQFEPVSVRATVSGGAGVEAYASVGESRMTVALVNENGADTGVTLTLGNFEPGTTAALYGNQGGATISKLVDVPVADGQVSVTLPATSIAMLVVDGHNPNPPPEPTTSSSSSGSGGNGSGGSGSGGANGNGADSDADSGCGCRAAGAPGGATVWAMAAAALAAASAARRRRR